MLSRRLRRRLLVRIIEVGQSDCAQRRKHEPAWSMSWFRPVRENRWLRRIVFNEWNEVPVHTRTSTACIVGHRGKEIGIENTLMEENGDKVHLKPGAEVKVTVEAAREATTPHDEKGPKVSAA